MAVINLTDIEELKRLKLTDEEVQARSGDAETFYRSHFEKVIKLLIQQQIEFMAREATDAEAFVFARGSVYGLSLVHKWFEDELKKSLSRFDKGEEPEKGAEQLRS